MDCGIVRNINGRDCQDNYLKGVSLILFTKRGENSFATLSAFTSAAITAAINNANPNSRFLVANNIEDATFEQEDAKAAIYSSGRMEYIRDSIMKTTFKHIGGDGKTHKAYVALNNADYEAYYFDQFGGMWYRKPEDTTLDQVQGIPISKGSTSPKIVPSNGTDGSEHVLVSQNWTTTLNVAELTYATAESLGFNIFDFANPLITVAAPLVSSITTTSAVIDLFSDRGTAIEGLTIANISTITADGVTKTMSSFVESTIVAGRYTATWTTAATATDIMLITYTGTDYDFYTPNRTTFVIPT